MVAVIGSILAGRYALEAVLGQGGMATVFRARRLQDGAQVAVKVLREPYAHDQEFVERFQREAQAAAALEHPNVVRVLDSGQEGHVRFIVMEYVQGEDLKTYLRKNGPLTPEEASRVASQVCAALEYAHSQGIVHRDIKPQNILLGEDGCVRVTDFGIARALSSATITETGTVLGSVHYLSPEQVRGDPVTTASDLYALGCVLHEMVTGRLPFDGDSPITVALKHMYEDPPAPRQVNPQVPLWLEGVIRRAMAKRPEDRYSSAAEMREDLEGRAEHWREGPTVLLASAGSNRFPERRRPWRSPVFLAAVVVTTLVGMAAVWRAFQNYLNVGEVMVPDFRGRPLAEVQALAAQLGLQIVVGGQQYSDRYPQNTVADQDPPPGQRVREGRWITVITSQGPEVAVVPDVTRRTLTEATLLLEQARLRVGTVQEDFDDQVPRGTVVSQEPAPGTSVPKGTEVRLALSRGPELVAVPNLVGLTLEEARAVLHQVGLALDRIGYVPRGDMAPGRVAEQQPAPGTRIRRSQRIGLRIAVAPVTVPAQGTPVVASPTEPAPERTAEAAPPPPVRAAVEHTGERSRRVRVEVTVPEGSGGEVRIVVIDVRGVRETYRQVHAPGERVVHLVEVEGYAIVQVYVDGRFLQEVRP